MKNLAQALVKAQSKFKAAKKDANNPFHKSKYADLESVWEAVQGPLAEEGLAISQTFRHEGEMIYLITHLIHVSGEMFTSEIPVIAVKKDPQGYGSAITYFRRYSLQSILCLVTSDDDGEKAHGRGKDEEPSVKQQEQPQVDMKQVLFQQIMKCGWPKEELKELAEGEIGKSATECSVHELRQILNICLKYRSLALYIRDQAGTSLT